jgi:hypothetical protein
MAESGQGNAARQTGGPHEEASGVRAPRTPRKPSLRDALAATHRQTVPLLPSVDLAEAGAAKQGAGGMKRAPRAKKMLDPDGLQTARILLSRPSGDGEQHPWAPTDGPTRVALPEAPAEIADELTALVVAHTPTGPPAPASPAEDGHALVRAGAVESQTLLIHGARRPLRRRAGRVVPRRTGPRSFVSQFVIAMVMAMTLFGTVALATPLGQQGIFGDLFTSYAQAVPWIPTATPTPRPTATPLPLVSGYDPPHGPNPGTQAIINDINAVFGQYAGGALNIARCESGYDPNARNPYPVGDSHAMGVFQILFPSTWSGTSYRAYSPYDYQKNILAAYEIFSRDGYSWREWECKPT